MDDEADFNMVMPFVAVRSNGGPFDDETYAAGYEMGHLEATLAARRLEEQLNNPIVDHVFTLRSENREQADLIAMRHGYIGEASLTDVPEWVQAEALVECDAAKPGLGQSISAWQERHFELERALAAAVRALLDEEGR